MPKGTICCPQSPSLCHWGVFEFRFLLELTICIICKGYKMKGSSLSLHIFRRPFPRVTRELVAYVPLSPFCITCLKPSLIDSYPNPFNNCHHHHHHDDSWWDNLSPNMTSLYNRPFHVQNKPALCWMEGLVIKNNLRPPTFYGIIRTRTYKIIIIQW